METDKMYKTFGVSTSDQELYKFNIYFEYGKLNIVSEDKVFNIFLNSYKKIEEGKYLHYLFIAAKDSTGCFLSIEINTLMGFGRFSSRYFSGDIVNCNINELNYILMGKYNLYKNPGRNLCSIL